jgi:hypothetical protein
MLNRPQLKALRFAAGEDVPPQSVKSDALIALSYRGLITLEGLGEAEQKVTITEAGRKALAESQ